MMLCDISVVYNVKGSISRIVAEAKALRQIGIALRAIGARHIGTVITDKDH